MHDISLFGIDVALAVESLDEVAVLAERVVAVQPHPRHDRHIQNDVDGVGYFDADFRERGTDHAHGIGNDVHLSALHLSARNLAAKGVRLGGIHPVVDGTRVLLILAADERARLYAGDVVLRRAVIVATGQFFLVELDHLARFARFLPERFELRFAPVDPYDFVGLRELRAFLYEIEYFPILGKSLHLYDLR